MTREIDKTIKDIKNLKIQGATNIAKAAVWALATYTENKSWKFSKLEELAEKLAFARPTEPLTQNCLSWFLVKAKFKEGENLFREAGEIIKTLEITKEKSIEKGLSLIKNGLTILTHCHSSTVVAILRKAKEKGIDFKVYLTETRPRYQGRITALELVKAGISATMITDSQAPFIISHEDKIKIDLILVGADAINTDGSAINKVGSYGISLSAKKAMVPFYVSAVLLKFSPLPIVIEERAEEEVWKDHPVGLKIFNPAFDRIPASFITNFITEVGLVEPEDVQDEVRKNYPWILGREQGWRIKRWLKRIPIEK